MTDRKRLPPRITCPATNRQGVPCQKAAGYGTGTGVGLCKFHGGLSPGGKKAAQNELARRAADMLGVPVQTDVFSALQSALDSANGMHLACQQLVREAAEAEDSKGLESAVRVYAEAIERLALTAKTYAGVGIEERQQRLHEAQGARLDAAFRALLSTMAAQYAFFTAEVQAEMRRVFAQKFRELTPRLE